MKAELYTNISFSCSECFESDFYCAGCRQFMQSDTGESCEVYCYDAIDETHLCSCCQDVKEKKEKKQ